MSVGALITLSTTEFTMKADVSALVPINPNPHIAGQFVLERPTTMKEAIFIIQGPDGLKFDIVSTETGRIWVKLAH